MIRNLSLSTGTLKLKSYSNKMVFFWSKNEISAAKILEDKYFLYLVDMERMSDPDYAPKIFQNPYQIIYENEFWNKIPETWKFSPFIEST